MRDIFTVIKFTMRDILSRKSFRISTILIVVLIVLGFNVPNFLNSLNGGNLQDTILVSDPENLFDGKLTALDNLGLDYAFKYDNLDLEEIKQKVNADDITAGIFIQKDPDTNDSLSAKFIVKNAALYNGFPPALIETLRNLYTNVQISKLGLSNKQLASLQPQFEFKLEQTEDQEIGGNIFVMMMLSVVLFFAIYFCAYQVSSSITIEKTSKIIETLVTSTTPRTIVLGKTIGIGLVGLGQIILFAVVALISAYSFLDPELLNTMLDLSSLTPLLGLLMIIYFILGYTTYALLYALTGSTVAKPEDIQSANTPVVILTMISFYLAYFTLMDPTGDLNIFAALFPFSSPFCMPLRVMMGVASVGEVLLSIGILIVTCIIIARVAIRIYSNAILNYGRKMSFQDILKSYKEK